MSKNLTRKGLALGAVVALGSSLFAGAPAFAAAALQVAPSTGTGYTVLASDAFTLKVIGNVDYTMSAASDLYWKVTQPSATASVVYSGTIASGTPTAASTSTVKIIDATATPTTTANTLTITPTIASTGASQDYIVQAYIESGLTAGQDANDVVVSSPVTVKFVKGSELTSTVTVDAIGAGLPVTGTFKYSAADFNYAMSTLSNSQVLVNLNGGAFGNASAVTLNTAEDAFEYSNNALTVAASSIVGVKSRITGYNGDTTYTNSAAVYSTAAAANDATAQDTTVTVGDNIKLISGDDYLVRTGTKSFSYRVDFTKASGVQAVAAGKPVRITVTEDASTIATNDVVRVNGKKLTGAFAATQSAVLNTVTDATGGITLTVESDLGLVSDKISIAVVPTGGTGTSTKTFAWTDAALTSLTQVDAQLNADKMTIVKGASVSLKYAIRDQFGKVWTKSGSSYRVQAAATSGSLVLTQTADFADGLATLTFTDNSTSAGTPDVTATLKVKTTGDYANDTTINSPTTVVTNLNVVTTAQAAAALSTSTATKGDGSGTVSSSTGTASDVVDRADATLSAIDLRSNANGAGLGVTAAKSAKFTGSVKNADGSPSQGATVTIAGAGLYFSTNNTGSSYVSAGSITVNATVAGTYEVYAFSKKGGSFAVTFTSGSVVKTQNVKFAAAAAADGKTLTITAPSSTLPGRAVDVVVLLVDKYGAPVTTSTASPIKVTLTGVGYANTIAANTDADGKISFKLILGANEVGYSVITATYDADDTATNYAAITTTANVNVVSNLDGAGATAAVAGSTKRFYLSVDGNSSAKNVVVKVAGKTFKTLKGSASKKTYVVAAPKGSHKVTIYVGGKLIATKTISVK